MSNLDEIRLAQEFVVNQVKKAKPGTIKALSWRQEEINALIEEIILILHLEDKSSVFTFTEKELSEGYGTEIWEKRLTGRVQEILAEIEG